MTRQYIGREHPAWHGFKPGDYCLTPTKCRAVVVGMGHEMRIEVRYIDGQSIGQKVDILPELLQRLPAESEKM